jgi:hypothetical protein
MFCHVYPHLSTNYGPVHKREASTTEYRDRPVTLGSQYSLHLRAHLNKIKRQKLQSSLKQ